MNISGFFIVNGHYSKATKESYSYVLNIFNVYLQNKNIDIKNVTPEVYVQFLENPRWGSSMKWLASNAIRAYIKWEFGDTHPILKVKICRKKSKPQRSLSEIQLGRLMEYFNTSTAKGTRDLAIICLLVETGLRCFEFCNLQLNDVDLENCRLSVIGKGNELRCVVFSRYTASWLASWLSYRQHLADPREKAFFVGIGGNKPGTKMTPGGTRKNFRSIAKNAGLPALSPHDLRRTFATLMTENGMPTRAVQKQGGWTDIRMVERYTQNLQISLIERHSPIIKIMSIE